MPLRRCWSPVPQHQPDAVLSQPNPTQNTWYTILDTRNARLYNVCVRVATTDETLEVRITVGNQVYAGTYAPATAGIYYSIWLDYVLGILDLEDAYICVNRTTYLEGRKLKVEMRKTTANGTGTFSGKCIWAKY